MRREVSVLLSIALLGASASQAEDAAPAPRFRAPLAIDRAAPFVEATVPVGAYARAASPSLADLRVLDADGTPVPYAWLAPQAGVPPRVEERADLRLFPLPAAAAASGPVELELHAGELVVHARGAGATTANAGTSPGWLVDLGERPANQRAPEALALAWSGPTEFSAGYTLATSDDLHAWRPAAGGQLLALAGPQGALAQDRVPLPADAGRYVRLMWIDGAARPAITGVQSVRGIESRARPGDLVTLEPAARSTPALGTEPARLEADLGGTLPVAAVTLRIAGGTRVLPVRLAGRAASDAAWQPLGTAVFHRVERAEGGASAPTIVESPAFELERETPLRQLQATLDPRLSGLAFAGVSLEVMARPAHLVFAAQGRPPYVLAVGAAGATPAALPVESLVPGWPGERARLGAAHVQDSWQEDAGAARAADAAKRSATWRTAALWAVLVGGVALLAMLAWRLVRESKPPSAS